MSWYVRNLRVNDGLYRIHKGSYLCPAAISLRAAALAANSSAALCCCNSLARSVLINSFRCWKLKAEKENATLNRGKPEKPTTMCLFLLSSETSRIKLEESNAHDVGSKASLLGIVVTEIPIIGYVCCVWRLSYLCRSGGL